MFILQASCQHEKLGKVIASHWLQ